MFIYSIEVYIELAGTTSWQSLARDGNERKPMARDGNQWQGMATSFDEVPVNRDKG